MTDHIVKSFDDELTFLGEHVLKMGARVSDHLSLAIDAVARHDLSQAENVKQRDAIIDKMEHEIYESAVKTLALRHPVAKDLRTVIGALKISSDLERMGDHATNIARRVRDLQDAELSAQLSALLRLHDRVQQMLAEVLVAYRDFSHEKATYVWHMDRDVDNMYASYFRELLTYMMADPRHIDVATQLLFMAKNIERAGDHVKNIAEMIYYIATGTYFVPPSA